MLAKLKIDTRSIVHLALGVEYVSEYGEHRDVLHFEKFNIWRDIDLLPQDMQQQLMAGEVGDRAAFDYPAGKLLEDHIGQALHAIPCSKFNRNPRKNLHIEPRLGRYYPRGWFGGIPGVFSEDMIPARLVAMDDDNMQVYTGHALQEHPLKIDIEVFDIEASPDEHGGRCNDSIAELLNGPGMNLRYRGQPTDFFVDDPFRRSDDALDGLFYAMPRMLNHLDEHALQQLKTLYRKLIPKDAAVLDLMSSINSHIADDIATSQVVGLGMNQQELEANQRLDQRVIHDLNDDPLLPFDDASFDVILCSLSIEYLTRPMSIYREAGRVLKPGGLFITSFSNRWFPTKAINLWTNLHEFERMGLVTEYFLQSQQFSRVNSHSVRGLSRAPGDRHVLPQSDPVYVVWGVK